MNFICITRENRIEIRNIDYQMIIDPSFRRRAPFIEEFWAHFISGQPTLARHPLFNRRSIRFHPTASRGVTIPDWVSLNPLTLMYITPYSTDTQTPYIWSTYPTTAFTSKKFSKFHRLMNCRRKTFYCFKDFVNRSNRYCTWLTSVEIDGFVP